MTKSDAPEKEENMHCKDTNIKDLLPAYVEHGLDPSERSRVESHLEACEDCRNEAALLMMLEQEPVPDPGEAFWASLPQKVYREVGELKDRKTGFGLSRLKELPLLPRWAWASAAMAAVLLAAWLVVSTGQRTAAEDPQLIAEAYDYGYGSLHDPALAPATANMSDLSGGQLDSIDSWAGRELARMSSEIEPAMLEPDSDPSDELAELDSGEIERLSQLLDQYKEG